MTNHMGTGSSLQNTESKMRNSDPQNEGSEPLHLLNQEVQIEGDFQEYCVTDRNIGMDGG